MAPKLYMFKPSPPVRSVLLCAKALGVPLELKEVNLLKGEHLADEYLQVNTFIFIYGCYYIAQKNSNFIIWLMFNTVSIWIVEFPSAFQDTNEPVSLNTLH